MFFEDLVGLVCKEGDEADGRRVKRITGDADRGRNDVRGFFDLPYFSMRKRG